MTISAAPYPDSVIGLKKLIKPLRKRVVDSDKKCITYYERHLYLHVLKKLQAGKMSFWDITWNDIVVGYPNGKYLHKIKVARSGYRVLLEYKGKTRLLIYNK